jgi:glycosyltransferase involved in cell wall biosynthesis
MTNPSDSKNRAALTIEKTDKDPASDIPKFSIIVTFNNQSKYVASSMERLIGQTYKNFEIICVDYGSQDNTLESLNRYSQLDARIHVNGLSQSSLFQARVDGIKNATGEFLFFLTAEDWLRLDACDLLGKFIQDFPADFYQIGAKIVDLNKSTDLEYQNYVKQFKTELIKVTLPDVFDAVWRSSFFNNRCYDKVYRTDLMKKVFEGPTYTVNVPEFADSLFHLLLLPYVSEIQGYSGQLVYHRWGTHGIEIGETGLKNFEEIMGDFRNFTDTTENLINYLNARDRRLWFQYELPKLFKFSTDLYSRYCELNESEGFNKSARESFLQAWKKYLANRNGLEKFNLKDDLDEYVLEKKSSIRDSVNPAVISKSSENASPSISCVMPLFNNEKDLTDTLNTIINQYFRDFELIIVDDDSMDNSLNIALEFANKDPRISVYQQTHRGAAKARNEGFQISRGDYVAFLDADDIYHKNLLSSLFKKITDTNSDIAICKLICCHSDGSQTSPSVPYKDPKIFQLPHFNSDAIGDILNVFNPGPQTKLYRSKFVNDKNLHFQEIPRFNDVLFWITSAIEAQSICFVDEILVDYQVSDRNVFDGKTRTSDYRDYLLPYIEAYNVLQVKGIYEKYRRTFINSLIVSAEYVFTFLHDKVAVAGYKSFLRTTGNRIFKLDQIKESEMEDYAVSRLKKIKEVLRAK